jgi:hypothetical protein
MKSVKQQRKKQLVLLKRRESQMRSVKQLKKRQPVLLKKSVFKLKKKQLA